MPPAFNLSQDQTLLFDLLVCSLQNRSFLLFLLRAFVCLSHLPHRLAPAGLLRTIQTPTLIGCMFLRIRPLDSTQMPSCLCVLPSSPQLRSAEPRIVAGFFGSPQEVFRLKCRGSRAAYAFLFLLLPFSCTSRAASRRGRNKWGGGL